MQLLRDNGSGWSARVAQGMAPDQTGKPGVVPIRGDPLATVFDGQGGEPGIGDQVALGAGRPAEPGKDLPVPVAWRHADAIGLAAELICENQGFRQ